MPNGKAGSGLTILVGGNNTGKTTIIEAIKYFNFDISQISFSSGKRNVQYELHGGFYDSYRWDYMNNENMNTKVRKPTIDNFQQRIFNWEKHKEKFDKLLYKIIDNNLKWYIDQNDNGSYYLAFQQEKSGVHTSEGIGDGIWSIFTIIDALYDAEEGSTIVIDEPELSLHPQYQKRVLDLLLEESANKLKTEKLIFEL